MLVWVVCCSFPRTPCVATGGLVPKRNWAALWKVEEEEQQPSLPEGRPGQMEETEMGSGVSLWHVFFSTAACLGGLLSDSLSQFLLLDV